MIALLSVTLLAGLLSLAAWLASRRSPAMGNALWRVALLSLTVFPAALIISDITSVTMGLVPRYEAAQFCAEHHLPNGSRAWPWARLYQQAAVTTGTGPVQPWQDRPICYWWQERLGLFVWWLAVGGILTSWIVRDMWWVRWFAIRGSRGASASLCAEVARLGEGLGLSRLPRVVVAPRLPVPVVVGSRRPTLALPEDFRLDAPGARAVLLHELSHVARHDTVWALLGRLARSALWWHPLAIVAARGQRHTAEIVCDERAVSVSGDAQGLAAQLVAGAERSAGLAVSIIGDDATHLRRRVDRLLRAPSRPGRDLRPALLTAVAALCLSLLGFVRLAKDAEHSALPAYPGHGAQRVIARVSGERGGVPGAWVVAVADFGAHRLAVLLLPRDFRPVGLEAPVPVGPDGSVDHDLALQQVVGKRGDDVGHYWGVGDILELDNALSDSPYRYPHDHRARSGYYTSIVQAWAAAEDLDADPTLAGLQAAAEAIPSLHRRVADLHARGDVSRLAAVLRCFDGCGNSVRSAALLRFCAELEPGSLRVETMPGRATPRPDGSWERVLDAAEVRGRLAELEQWARGGAAG